MTTENHYCDRCKKQTTFDGKKREPLYGVYAEISYSKGGWGMACWWVDKTTMLVCTDCYELIKKQAKEFAAVLTDVRPVNKLF